ncbi:TIGR01777 family oxidoreductase [Erythrobacter sp. THAF29]|uniref:TIGR01777 family oxidoreductase n=1 Tax=Erythrobacter sp. THAF29 TaxID=2587851 RepID=UPI00126865CD|nr:TIGR01777 family oxidoreductase [Erythrobacter sp. THAF29]QFT76617.1 Epimerase family protein [Erythrobacter sp. THAF29]
MGAHIVIGGGSGFVGSAITEKLRARGDRVTWISRHPGPDRITWGQLAETGLPQCDAVINLAGMHILNPRRRWNAAYREEVIRSRVETTQTLVDAINRAEKPPELFVSTAGKCFYGTGEIGAAREYPELDEDAEPMGIDFPAELVGQWEKAAEGIDTSRVRHAKVRIAIVLGAVRREGFLSRLWRIGNSRGFLPIIRLPFCLGLGCVIGEGRQPFPWIHIDDCAALFLHLIDNRDLSGRFNAVAPESVTSEQFIRAFASHLRRPIVWRAPQWLIMRLVGAERASILLEGQKVVPRRTLESGFRFKYPTLDEALGDLVEITV